MSSLLLLELMMHEILYIHFLIFFFFINFIIKVFIVMAVFQFNDSSLFTFLHVLSEIFKMTDNLAESTFSLRIFTLDSIMSYLIRFRYLGTTAFANYLHKDALIKLVCSKYEFIICQLVLALCVVTPKSNLIYILNLKFIEILQSVYEVTLARCFEELS
jgi:hypothetical protein